MTMFFFCLTASEQELIRKAYDFEIEASDNRSFEPNPYREEAEALGVWEAIKEGSPRNSS